MEDGIVANFVHEGRLVPFQGQAKRGTRVCCISDTHLVHSQIEVPFGDVLVHSGDVLTESLLRHVEGDGSAKNRGVELFTDFAKWFCAQPHSFKVLIAGNHDGAMEAMGAEKIRAVLDAQPGGESVVYLEHETATAGHLKVFGSPFGHWGSHNNAFSMGNRDYSVVEADTHIFVSHYPPILPGENGLPREHTDIVESISSSGALLSVSGHCHWAYGVYHSSSCRKTPFVVASNCGSGWKTFLTQKGERLDYAWDKLRGGYNYDNPCVVVDIDVETPDPAKHKWEVKKKK